MKKILLLLVLLSIIFMYATDDYYTNNPRHRIINPVDGNELRWDDTYRAFSCVAMSESATLATGVTTYAVTSRVVTLTGDGAANTIGTITGANAGIYTFIFVDANITITDTDVAAADKIDLAETATNFTSAEDTTLTLVYNGKSWFEVSRSVN